MSQKIEIEILFKTRMIVLRSMIVKELNQKRITNQPKKISSMDQRVQLKSIFMGDKQLLIKRWWMKQNSHC